MYKIYRYCPFFGTTGENLSTKMMKTKKIFIISVLGKRVLSRQFITKAKKLNGVRDPPLGIKRKEKLRAILMRFE